MSKKILHPHNSSFFTKMFDNFKNLETILILLNMVICPRTFQSLQLHFPIMKNIDVFSYVRNEKNVMDTNQSKTVLCWKHCNFKQCDFHPQRQFHIQQKQKNKNYATLHSCNYRTVMSLRCFNALQIGLNTWISSNNNIL